MTCMINVSLNLIGCGLSMVFGLLDLYCFCAVYELLFKLVPFKVGRSGLRNYPAHIWNLIDQKERIFSDVLILRRILITRVWFKLDAHLRKFLAYGERFVSKQPGMKGLHAYVRNKFKVDNFVPTMMVNECSSLRLLRSQHSQRASLKCFRVWLPLVYGQLVPLITLCRLPKFVILSTFIHMLFANFWKVSSHLFGNRMTASL